MKLYKFINSLMLTVLLLSLGACRDEVFDQQGHWNGKVPDEWTVTLVIPDPQEVNLGTRANEADVLVDRLNVICYDQNGVVLSNQKLTEDDTDWDITDNTITVTLSLAGQETARVDVIANSADADQITKDSKKTAESILANQDVDDKSIFWGSAPIETVISDSAMPMIRNAAMLTVENNATATFELLEMGVFGTYDSGTIAPVHPDGSIMPTEPTIHNDSEKLGWVDSETVLNSDKAAELKDELKENKLYKSWSATDNSIDRIYETEAGNLKYEDGKISGDDFVRVILYGRYTDPSDGTSCTGYYVVALSKRSNGKDDKGNTIDNPISEHPGDYIYGDALPVLRNHKYILTITDVRGDGWTKLSDAMTALPDNRITVMCEDKSPNVTDIEATRDYYIGVSGSLTVDYNANATISITTTYPGLNKGQDDWNTWRKRLVFENEDDDDWIDVANITANKPDSYCDTPLEIEVTIPLSPNLTSRARYGNVKVRAGKLFREISITQLACPYNRRRAVKLEGITKAGENYTFNDYLSFLDGKKYNEDGTIDETANITEILQGVSTAENRNANRTALHFPLVPLYDYDNYKFTIPGKDADGTPKFVNNSGTFTFTTTGTGDNKKYVITLSAAAKSEIKSSSDIFRIPTTITDDAGNERSVNVDYNVYRTGIIHYLAPSSAAEQPDVPEVQKSGWFYYDIARVGNCLVLDRNLGANTSKAYSPGATKYKNNKDAIGGYFKVNNHRWANYNATEDIQKRREDQETITHALHLESPAGLNSSYGPGKFVPATESDYNSMNLTIFDGAVQASTTTSRVPNQTVYFPKAGYYEGDEFKSASHCLLWTRTYLGGTQGLGPDAPEYGYWYRYYDDMKSSNAANRFSNVRMARGSSGNEPDESSLWRYMPLRLVWVDSNCQNTSGGSYQEEQVIVSNRMIIYFRNLKEAPDLKYNVWNVSSGATTWGNLPLATKVTGVEGEDNLYKVEIGYPTSNNAGIQFTSSDNTKWTWDYKELYSSYNNGETVLVLEPKNYTYSTEHDQPYNRWTLECVDSYNIDIFANGGHVDPPVTDVVTYKIKIGSTTRDLTQVGTTSTWKLEDYSVSGSNNKVTVYKYVNGTETVSYGLTNNTITLNTWKRLEERNEGITLSSAGTYTFEFNTSNQELRVTGTSTPVTVQRDIYLRGSMTGNWSAQAAYKMETSDYQTYTITVSNLGTGEFKFGTGEASDWTKAVGGDGNAINSEGNITTGDKNLKLGSNLSSKTLKFTLIQSNDFDTVTLKIEIEETESDTYNYKIHGQIFDGNWTDDSANFTWDATEKCYKRTVTCNNTNSFGIKQLNKSNGNQVGWINGTSPNIKIGDNTASFSGSNWNLSQVGTGTYVFRLYPSKGILNVTRSGSSARRRTATKTATRKAETATRR